MASATQQTTANASVRAGRFPLTTILFWALLVVGVAWRIVWLFSNSLLLDADRGVVYLMATEVRSGEFPTMYWGQGYGGSLLSLVAGVVMLVTGSHIEVLGIVSILFFAGAAVLVRSIGAHMISRTGGDVAGVAFWFPGYALFWLALADPGFYGPTLVCALAAVLIALRGGPQRGYVSWAAVGLLAGVATWQSPMGAALALPAVVIMMFRQPSWRHWLVGIAGGVIGAAPWLFQLLTARATTAPLGGQQAQPRSFVTFFTELFTYALGVVEPSSLRWLVGFILVALIVMLGVVGVLQRNRWMIAMTVGSFLAYVVVVLGSGVPLRGDSFRYAIFLVPVLALAIAWLATRLRPLAYVALFAFPALTAGQAVAQSPAFAFDQTFRFGVGMPALVRALDDLGVHAVYADYWASYSLSAATDGRITADALTLSRYPKYAAAAEAADPMVIVVYENLENDQLLSSRTTLPSFTRTTAGGYAIYLFDEPFDVGTIKWNLF